mmetsp:Transcript_3699/g.7642  ORF Transcript_3699/g.7642 Transcript_3699/m.7642 type:complete len:694 (-) Transcript_3699:180-2261(-)|eukprot:CAMPEP_0118924634 /NCGR_PEP_ID=MMETSP1169-20130426/2680_1 /TAXON_ID=36882 /ORGANISM="Pyramimonas obovata, Strain CCMP722" /LENGTH=693 /DNA_ID=CAMNT_0006865765 /DNA_START=43 /DNA_END=2124 /DNA_ORIENTATION=-
MAKKDDDVADASASATRNMAVGGVLILLVLAMGGWLAHERAALQKETLALHAELSGDSGGMQDSLAALGYSAGGKDPTTGAPGPEGSADGADSSAGPPSVAAEGSGSSKAECEDKDPHCPDWARGGECLTNKDWMTGTDTTRGNCLLSCGKCDTISEGGASEAAPGPETSSEGSAAEGQGVAQGPASAEQGATPAATGEAQGPVSATENPAPAAVQSVETPADSVETVTIGCADKSANCKTWALHGECTSNPEYMIGANGYEGQCMQACGKCPGAAEAFDSKPTPNGTKPNQSVAAALGSMVAKQLRWPQKKAAAGRLCVGLSTAACQRGLYSPQAPDLLDAADRSITKGVGGPTGCAEAWATSITQDDQIAAVLTMIYTLRKFTNEDRDIVVFVTEGVSEPYIQQLMQACVILKLVKEPLDPKTHMGFMKLNLWLAVEYTKVAYIEYDAWIRADPSEIFTFNTPAAIKTAPHARLMNEMFGSYFFLLEPNRQTFYDMLAKVGTIDSAERVDNQTVYTERLFFSGYFDKWYIMPSHFLEFEQDVISTIIPELTNTRIRRIVKSMPPYSPDTVIDYSMIAAKGIFVNLHVKPWQPGWRIPCAWECRFRKYHQLYEAVSEEWWHHYYNMVDMPIPSQRSLYNLVEFHDPNGLFAQKDFEHCLPFNCDIPDAFVPNVSLEPPPAPPARKGRRGKFM